MNLIQSTKTYDDLLRHMHDCGYSSIYIERIKREIRWLLKQKDKHRISSYECIYRERVNDTNSDSMKEQYLSIYGLIRQYSLYGELSKTKRNLWFRRSAYTQLNDYYKNLLDCYNHVSKKRGLKEGTTKASISACSGLLLSMQKRGHKTLERVSEGDVLSYFTDEDGNAIMSKSSKANIVSVFEAELGFYSKDARRILTYLPALRRNRKTIQYLTPEEINIIKSILIDRDSNLSLRNRAIGNLLMYTGMRSGDIASMKFSDINWQTEEIRIIQMKTENELLLPLSAIVGNAIYDYINNERPKIDCECIFLCALPPYHPISSGTVGNDAAKIYKVASIRQDVIDMKGAHLFRHNLATTMTGLGISRPIISSTLGHIDPDSLDHYLFADIKNLRECALSIEEYPIREGVLLI